MQISSSVHPPSLEPADTSPIKLASEQKIAEMSTTEKKIEPVPAKPQSGEIIPAPFSEISDKEEDLTQSPQEELTRESPQLPDSEGAEGEKPQAESTPSTTIEVSIVATVVSVTFMCVFL